MKLSLLTENEIRSKEQVIRFIGNFESNPSILEPMLADQYVYDKSISLSKIKSSLINKDDINKDKFGKAYNSIKDGETILPIVLGKDWYVADGMYRYLAAKQLGLKTIPALVPISE